MSDFLSSFFEYRPPERKLQLVFLRYKKMRCVFSTLVVRVDALREKYNGGLKSFVQKHGARSNGRIALLYAMANFYLDEAISDLDGNGLVTGEDYLCFEPTCFAMIGRQGQKVDLGVTWLGGYVHGDGMMVYYRP